MDFSSSENVHDRWNDPEYIKATKKSIAAWRTDEPSVLSYVLGLAAAPLSWAVHKLIPSSAIQGVLTGIDWCTKQSLSGQSATDPENLAECDRHANVAIDLHIVGGVVEGGAAGFFGILTLPADIPALIALALRVIRQVGAEYGYVDDKEHETQFVFSVLSASGANSQAEKAEALAMAALLMNVLGK